MLSLDCELGVDEDHFQFGSSVSLYDYDVVFWKPSETLRIYSTYSGTFKGKDSLSEHQSARLISDVERRRAEFLEFVEMGRCLVVILPGDTEVYVDTGERTYSGTGRNRTTNQIVKKFDLMSAIPTNIERTYGTGVEMTSANDLMASLFRKTRAYWAYRCVLKNDKTIRPLLHVKGTKKSVAGLIKTKSGGLLILLPDLLLPFADDEEHEDDADSSDGTGDVESKGEAVDEQDDEAWPADLLLSWIESMVVEPDSSLPSWTANYRFPSEVERAAKQIELERELAEVQHRLDIVKAEQAQDERWKTLITGSGPALERRVREALELFGFALEEGDAGRTDLRGEYKGQRIVVEVKGVTKSAAEKNAAQLEKWISEEIADGAHAKGILVVNTWRDTPLRNRTEGDFPDQMLRYCIQREHCLVTGLQLLAMARACHEDGSRKAEIAELLMTTVGPIENWTDLPGIFAAETATEVTDVPPENERAAQVGTAEAPSNRRATT
ncbi:MAG TPA: hypothetical protein VF557_00990 [Jatrophihabitans sp.]|uniref:hypothetical protein n=1 Tax=Jatrophihabitans sp. TaxID=1932789 RepID=UPI002EDE4880